MKSLILILDKNRKIKLYKQIYKQIAEKIENSEISVGEKLPSVRTLSKELNVGKNTITKAYSELEKNAYIYSVEKSGFYAKLPSNKNLLTVPILKDNSDISIKSVPTVDSLLEEKDYQCSTNFSLGTDNSGTQNTIFEKNTISSSFSNSKQQEKTFTEEFFSNADILNLENSPVNCYGEEIFIKKLKQFLSKNSNFSVSPFQIIIASSIEQIIFNILQLPSIREEKKTGVGLLKLAEKSLTEKKQNFLILKNESEKIKKIFSCANFSRTELDISDFKNLQNFDANIFYLSEENMQENLKNYIFNWLNQNKNRKIFKSYKTLQKDTKLELEGPQEKILYFFSLENLLPQQVQINAAFSILPAALSDEYKKFYADIPCSLSKIDQIAISNFLEKNL